MNYTKQAKTLDEQADLLISRGLLADKASLLKRLKDVNYYRLSGYLYPFRNSDDSFKSGVTLDLVWRQYTFDRHLRLIVLDAIERVEVSVRTKLAYQFAHKYDAFSYADYHCFPNLPFDQHLRWFSEVCSELIKSRDYSIKHFLNKYGDCQAFPPIWNIVETFTFGKTVTMYRGVGSDIQKSIADDYGLFGQEPVFMSWLLTLNEIRNVCAHHGRLWNRILGNRPKFPHQRKNPEWYTPILIGQDHLFGVLTILRYLLRFTAPTSNWHTRLTKLFSEYPEIPLAWMGFPSNWAISPLWIA